MNRKRMLLSFFSLIFSTFLLIVVSFAWFAVSNSVENSPIDFSVKHGTLALSDIYYYTYSDVYRYNLTTSTIQVYENSLWVTPTYYYSNGNQINYEGILAKKYDPLIPVKNEISNTILAMHFTYEVEEPATLSLLLAAAVDTDIATDAIANITHSSVYYLSHVSYLQEMVNSSYSSEPVGTNLYSDLTDDFNTITWDAGVILPVSEPSTPSNGDQWFNETTNTLYTYNGTWDTGVILPVSEPSTPSNGDRWFDETIDTLYIYDEYLYSFNSFYDSGDNFVNQINFSDSALSSFSGNGDIYLYINFSYYPEKVEDTLQIEQPGYTFADLPIVWFFPDIKIVVTEGGS